MLDIPFEKASQTRPLIHFATVTFGTLYLAYTPTPQRSTGDEIEKSKSVGSRRGSSSYNLQTRLETYKQLL